LIVLGFLSRPFAFFGTLVRVFGAVVEAEFPRVVSMTTRSDAVRVMYLPMTTLASER
jgi:hypothetical protein